MELVSIVLPTYNGEQFLRCAIDSIIAQTYQNWELIIVNDCSNDSTPEIAEEYAQKDARIKVIHNKQNKRISASLNAGFEIAQGTYLTWTSDDNYYLINAIEKLVGYLDNNSEDIMVHSAYTCKNLITNKEDIVRTKTSVDDLLRGCTCGPCFMYRASAAKTIGDYDTSLHFAQDWDYWLRMLLHGNIAYIDENMYVYRLHGDCLTVKCKDELYYDDALLKRKYRMLYAEKYPYVRECFLIDFISDEYMNSKNIQVLAQLNEYYSSRVLYKEFKNRYKCYKDNIWLVAIKTLGFIYWLKAINLKYKRRKGD